MNAQTLITEHFRLDHRQLKGLEKLGLATIADLLFYLPARYGAPAPEKPVSELVAGESATVYGQVTASKVSKAWRKKIPLGEITLKDQSGAIKAVWFHQPYLAKRVAVGQFARLQGKVALRAGKPYLANPEIGPAELFGDDEGAGFLTPVYPETRGLSSNWFHHAIKKLLNTECLTRLVDPLPADILKKYNLPTLATALVWIHSPRQQNDADAARKRFAFQEIFFIQLERLKTKQEYVKESAFRVSADKKAIENFSKRFPFALTGAQERAITQIMFDLGADKPMTRLLEGDVGSGKTAVAAITASAVVGAGLEVAYMAPTEILARQHFDSFINYFKHLPGIQVGLITGSGCYKFPSKIPARGGSAFGGSNYTNISRSQLLKWVANGEIPILVGTHALIQKTVKFKNLAYVIIDEQHRFGVMQRAKLARKSAERAPHLLSMTATPIPRTLALTIYGDLDLTLLDELPAGRRPIITEIVTENKRAAAYEKIRAELATGRQAFVICPRIDEPDPTKELALQAKSAKAEAKRLQEKVFPEFTVGLVHSKLPAKGGSASGGKEAVMANFARGAVQVLVATSVVEVGVNVPNATVIVIEGAERFGLAQLHQLRGRVLRSSHQAYCYLFSEGKTNTTLQRLKALGQAKNGFELAELDLNLRGAGALAGGKQWGLSDIGMEAIKNLKMVEAARAEAQALLKSDPDLKNHPLIRAKLSQPKPEIHFE